MEIKKGISQMSEYPNVEINYVLSRDGRMNYVVKDGLLENGCVIATLDPKHAIDSNNACENVGVFSNEGDIIIDFDKKDISKITDSLLLVVNAKPTTNEVLDAMAKKDDQISNSAIEENKNIIISKMIEEMGPSGEIIFADSYSEANVYAIDSYNNKLGLDCSFIGKNNEGLYFHTNEVNSESKFIKVEDFSEVENTALEEVQVNNEEVTNTSMEEDSVNNEEINDTPLEESRVQEVENNNISNVEEESDDSGELKLDISKSILDGFKVENEELNKNHSEEVNINSEEEYESSESDEEDNSNEISNDVDSNNTEDEVFDNAIDIINRMIDETGKLKSRIEELERQVMDQQQIIDEQENKKDELNTLLGKANQVLKDIK